MTPTLPGWTVIETAEDGGPKGWKHEDSGSAVGFVRDETNEFDAEWLIRGENSIHDTADSLEEAREQAIEYISGIGPSGPSPMV